MIEGFLETVSQTRVTGWARDASDPSRRLKVVVRLGGDTIGEAVADAYRADLLANGIEPGNFAFSIPLDPQAPVGSLESLAVEAETPGGPHALPRLVPNRRGQSLAGRFPAEWPSDASQFPVFVLGAARSGTSAMANALLGLPGSAGFAEGHFVDLLPRLQTAINDFYEVEKASAAANAATMLANLPRRAVHGVARRILADVMATAFAGSRRWIDKTPTTQMIVLSSAFAEIWPNARFVFMRRRFFENLASRRRKFPGDSFEASCIEWSGAMHCWTQVSPAVKRASIEVDQRDLQTAPEAVAARLRDLLALTEDEAAMIARAFRSDFPERTGDPDAAPLTLADLGLSDAQMEFYKDRCAGMMRAFGYSGEESYYIK